MKKHEQKFFRLGDEGVSILKERWKALSSRYTKDESRSETIFNLLVQMYTEKHRSYHNLSHIDWLLALSDSMKDEIGDYDAIRFAIWFHDAVYNTRRNDNEEKSAEMSAASLEELAVPVVTAGAVREMILATKHHHCENLTEDAKLFLDLDLSILGASEEVYRAYSEAIRKEYSWVPRFLYRRSRKKILNDFLRRERIFLTEDMRARFDLQARRNIKREIESLSS